MTDPKGKGIDRGALQSQQPSHSPPSEPVQIPPLPSSRDAVSLDTPVLPPSLTTNYAQPPIDSRAWEHHLVQPRSRKQSTATSGTSASNTQDQQLDATSKVPGVAIHEAPTPPDDNQDSDNHLNDPSTSLSSHGHSHNLQGGYLTRDLYKLKEKQDQEAEMGPRAYSTTDLEAMRKAEEEKRLRDLKMVGGFRRHFVRRRAEEEGRSPPTHVTRNFVEFLVMAGNLAGGWYCDDEDEDEDEDGVDEEDWDDARYGADMVSRAGPSTLARPRSRHLPPTEQTALLHAARPATPTPHSPRTHPRHHQQHETQGTASFNKAFLLLIKSFIGTGVLFLPKAVYNGGLSFSIVFLFVVAYLNYYGMLLLVQCTLKIPGTFGDLANYLYGPKMKFMVQASIASMQLGICMAYFIFIAQNLKDLIAVFSDCRIIIPESHLIFLQLVIYIPLSLVRKIKTFAMTALVADVFILFGLAYIMVVDIEHLSQFGAARVEQFNPEKFALFFGTATFAFEGVGMIVPICSAMKEPKQFPKVLGLTTALTCAVMVVISTLSYLTFGSKVNTIILLNMPPNAATQTAQFFYIFAIVFTFPLMLFPALKILEQWAFDAQPGAGKRSRRTKWKKNTLRLAVVTLASASAWAGSTNLDHFVSLIGSFACIPLGFIYPALFHYRAVATTRLERVKDILLGLVGACVMVVVVFITVLTWRSGAGDGVERCPSGELEDGKGS